MGDVLLIDDYLDEKIAYHREQMQLLMLKSRLLVDAAVEDSYDFTKIKQSRDILDKAVWHSNEIKRLEIISLKVKRKA